MPRAATWVLLGLSALLAIAYGVLGPGMYESGADRAIPAALKTSGIAVLALIAFLNRAPLLAIALAFGAAGDALLALGDATFLWGAGAFLIGHLFYITLFLRNGLGFAAFKQPPRALAALALIAAAVVMTGLLVPADNSMFAPLAAYTGVLTLMALISFTLPSARWLAMLGGVLFFISDGFVAANLFHPQSDAALAFGLSFTGWMIYWAAQASLCIGGLALSRVDRTS
ncbi:MAG: lysoplasmalogenase [Terricaulis sp.]|nr:lysoplasmalogenase [Terricaulis sp.]